VAACRAAVEAGRASGSRVGPLVNGHVIARPHQHLGSVLPVGGKSEKGKSSGRAIGVIETKGFNASVEAADAALKTAQVVFVGWQKPGSALSAVIIQGDVAAVRSGVDAGADAARAIGEVVSTLVIPRPHDAVGEVVIPPKKK
jgi:ethanolamine utilization protein EutM